MTDENVTGAPERIWAAPEHPDENGYGGFWIKHKVAPAIEYIRADLAPGWHRIDYPNNMTLRDWFAGQSLTGVLSTLDGQPKDAAETAGIMNAAAMASYALADAMLRERKKKQT